VFRFKAKDVIFTYEVNIFLYFFKARIRFLFAELCIGFPPKNREFTRKI